MISGFGIDTGAGYSCYNSDGSPNYFYSLFHSGCDFIWNPAYWGVKAPPTAAMVSVPTAPTGSVLTVAPSGSTEATTTVDQMISQGITNQQSVAQGFFDSLNVTIANSDGSTSTIPWYMTLAIGVGIVGLVSMLKGKR